MTAPGRAPSPDPVVLSWSGGKDSSLALQRLLADPALRVAALLTTITRGYDRISMHGVRRTALEAQCATLGLPLIEVAIHPGSSNDAYDDAFRAALYPLAEQGIHRVAFGDLYLRDIRAYRERLVRSVGMDALFPLWNENTGALARRFIGDGFRATVVCVDPKQIDSSLCGREFDERFLADLPASADPCGENGEFHTFVHDGPIYSSPVSISRGEAVLRDGFWFCDLLPAPAAPS